LRDVTEEATRRPDRRSARKHESILTAAVDLFLANGYERTSVDAVALAAGVGKQTVYSHFAGKETLFLAAVESARSIPARTGDGLELDPARPPEGLQTLGAAVLDVVLDPTVAALQRLTISELPRHPQLQAMWRTGAQNTRLLTTVTSYLERCHESGSLVVREAERVARQFVFLLATEARTSTAYGTAPLTNPERARILRETTDLFMASLGVDHDQA
jgi:TetR/AcrR family transcriptional repressor of mexJK operon